MNFAEVIFRPIKRLKLIGNWFPERSASLYFVLSREKRIMGHYVVLVSVSPVQFTVLFALLKSRVDLRVSNN